MTTTTTTTTSSTTTTTTTTTTINSASVTIASVIICVYGRNSTLSTLYICKHLNNDYYCDR